jgi:hypothetical protein
MAKATASGDGPVDQRLPTWWTSPRRSRSCSRASALPLFRPAARATIAVENKPGISRSAARRRSRPGLVWPLSACAFGAGTGAASGRAGSGAGFRPIGGSSPNRARQLPHKTTGSRPGGWTTSNRRHPRPERQTPQRRPARSISIKSTPFNWLWTVIIGGVLGTDGFPRSPGPLYGGLASYAPQPARRAAWWRRSGTSATSSTRSGRGAA